MKTVTLSSFSRHFFNFGAMLCICFTVGGFAATAGAAGSLKKDAGERIHLAIFTSAGSSGFWPLVEDFSSAVAEDLNIELKTYRYADPIAMMKLVHSVLDDPAKRPDGILFHNHKHQAPNVLKAVENAGVPALMFNAGPTEKDDIGVPRERFKQYIGLLTPNDYKAGFDLATILIEAAERKDMRGSDGKIHIIALEGNRNSGPAIARKNGLKDVVAAREDVVIDQFFDTHWRREKASSAFVAARARYSDAKVFWAASDSMALGALDGAEMSGAQPGIDFISGGIDLLPSIQPLVHDGRLAASIGAHYTEAAWAVVLMYDYLSGCDFIDLPFQNIKTTMLTITEGSEPLIPGNSDEAFSAWSESHDFRSLSRCLNPKTKTYDFNAGTFFGK